MWPFNKIRKILDEDRAHGKNIEAIMLKIYRMPSEEAMSRCEPVLADSDYYECVAANYGVSQWTAGIVGPLLSELFGRYSSIKSPWIDIGNKWPGAPPADAEFIYIGMDHSQSAFVKRGADSIYFDPVAYDVPEPTFISVYHLILADYFTSPQIMERGLTI